MSSGRPSTRSRPQALYTPEQRCRRDATRWTLVQGVLAPIQFLVFLVSLCLIGRYFLTGDGLAVATGSIVVKTLVLYAIMITGSIWEKIVFGRWLFARSFFWEDVFSMLVLALHTAYLACLVGGLLGCHLAGERRAFAAAFEAARAGARPAQRVALRVGDRHGRVVECRLDVGDAHRNVAPRLFLGFDFSHVEMIVEF